MLADNDVISESILLMWFTNCETSELEPIVIDISYIPFDAAAFVGRTNGKI